MWFQTRDIDDRMQAMRKVFGWQIKFRSVAMTVEFKDGERADELRFKFGRFRGGEGEVFSGKIDFVADFKG